MLQTIFIIVASWQPSVLALVKNDAFPSSPPRKSSIAIVFRGQTFREEKHGTRYACMEFARPFQLNNSASVVEKIIEPLEQLGNKVDVVITDEPCSMTHEVSAIYGKRVVASETFAAGGQAENIRRALDVLNAKCGGVQDVSNKYDYVLVLRHDERVILNFNDWKADWSTINFFAHCEKEAPTSLGSEKCVWDTLHLVPGNFYETFNDVIGASHVKVRIRGADLTYSCFAGADPNGHGHACYYPMLAALQAKDRRAKLGVVLPLRFRVRSPNEYLALKMPHEWDAALPTD